MEVLAVVAAFVGVHITHMQKRMQKIIHVCYLISILGKY